MTDLPSHAPHRSPRLNRVAVWVSALIAVELAAVGAVLVYRALADEPPAGYKVLWTGIFLIGAMSIPAAFWTVVWALRSRRPRIITAWAAFTVLMISTGLTAWLTAGAIVSLRQPLG
jgi:hypothetical protein